jgi:CDP-6-deoxy-D-xylo-4-hexulose-3-dehydrase
MINKKLNWPLQENVLGLQQRKKLSNFILKTQRFTQSSEVKKFEKNYAKWQGCKYSIFVNSGSSANLLITYSAKEIFKWTNNDEVIVPALTWPTTVTPIIQANLKPVFVDCNIEDLSFDYNDLKKKITARTKAIFVAHIIGFPANIHKIKEIIKGKNIIIFEDTCESTGAFFKEKKVGNFGLASSFSFYWGHHLTTVEGGMICTNNEKFYNTCLLKRSHGLARELPKKMHIAIKKKYKNIDFRFLFLNDGFNLRNTEINAYLGNIQLKFLNKWIKIRNENYKIFTNLCEKFNKHLVVIKPKKGISSFVFPFLFKNKTLKNKFIETLNKNKIENRPLIAGNLLKQPFLKNYKNKLFKNADFLHENCIYIGNNQFVNKKRLENLKKVLYQFFK